MTLADGLRAEELLNLARVRFDSELREIEVQVIYHSCRYDNPPDCIKPQRETTEPDLAPSQSIFAEDGRPTSEWLGPELRPSFLRWLLTDPDATSLLEHRGLRVWSARFSEPLDLSHCRIPVRVEFRYCLFTENIDLTSAEMLSLFLKESLLQGDLNAPRLSLKGALFLRGVVSEGFANLNQVRVGAEVYMAHTRFNKSLSFNNAKIEDDIVLCPKFCCSGSLNCDSIRVGGSAYLANARIASVRMVGAEIGKQLSFNGARILETRDSILLEAARIQGGVYFRHRFRCRGRISLRGAVVEGSLDFEKAVLTTSGTALSLEGARVRVAIFLRNNLLTRGMINMHGVEIGGQLDCANAKFKSRDTGLSLEASVIGGHVLLNKGFTSLGTVRLSGAKIGGQLSCEGSHINTLLAENAEIRGDLVWRDIVDPSQSSLRLTGAKVRFLRDDRASWPGVENLEVTGFVAEDLRLLDVQQKGRRLPVPLNAHDRIEWLNRQPEPQIAEPQPWLQLAKLLEGKGQKRDAKRVIFELSKHQSQLKWQNRRGKRIGQALDRAFGRLEERPIRILFPLTLCVVLGTALFWPMEGRFSPKSELTDKATRGIGGEALVAYPKFQPLVYALENVLPVVKLGQDDLWAPDPRKAGVPLYWSLMLMRWFLIIAGYIQGGILAAALGARFRSQ
jgi:hypothetical protein